MQNFNILDDNKIHLPGGVFAGVESYVCYPGGELEGIRLSEKNMLVTHAGELVPAYTETHRRKVKYSVEFFRNGMIKAVALDEQQEIQTPIGEFPAELVTFFETGELKRFFPLDGKISGLWSEEEEKDLAIPFCFDIQFTKFTAVIASIGFYKSGNIRSITLFPGEEIIIQTVYGEISVRGGFSLYESGELESLEPLNQAQIQTQIGLIACFDPNAIGVNADSNSLMFDKQGRVISLVTVSSRIAVQTADGRFLTFAPRKVVNPLNNETMMTEGLSISFDYAKGTVTFGESGEKSSFTIDGNGFTVIEYKSSIYMCSLEDCASCSLGCK
ncbi:MAG: hypothetical protein LBC52_03180 [Treponema sp.]|jgi:hypothetical protein|nr:hypothetical protein [Treponema sp.]